MKMFMIAILFALFITGCKKDNAIKPSDPPAPDYLLPQGKSPADSRIVDLYKKYNTYFLYEYSVADFNWNQIGKRQGSVFSTNGNPEYVQVLLDLLEDKWFRFYPEAFLREHMPYNVFLSDSLYYSFDGDNRLIFADAGVNNLALGYVNSSLSGKDNLFRKEYKNAVNTLFWEMMIDRKVLTLPASFFTVSNYTRNTLDFDPDSPDYFKARGFVEDYSSLESSEITDSQQLDVKSFIKVMVSMKKSEWDIQLLNYPLIKKKYDILQVYILSKYNIDLQLIGDAE